MDQPIDKNELDARPHEQGCFCELCRPSWEDVQAAPAEALDREMALAD